MKKTFGINVISSASGILPHTIRTWENRYQVFSPDRSVGGQRLYGEDDVVKAKLIVTLIDQGHTISSLAKHSLNDLRSLMVLKNTEKSKSNKVLTKVGTKTLLQYLTDYNIDSVASELRHLRLTTGVKEFIFEVILPVMHEIEKLALLSPKARVNIIRNYAVADKKMVEIPEKISGTVHCSNDNCISNNERGAISQFKLLDAENLRIQCIYCGRKIVEDEISFL